MVSTKPMTRITIIMFKATNTILQHEIIVNEKLTRCDQKLSHYFQIPWVTFDDRVSHFFGLLGWYTCLVYTRMLPLPQPFWIVSFFLTDKMVSLVLVCSSNFYYSEKWIKKITLNFVWKNEIKYARIFEMLTVAFGESTISRTQVQLWYNRFTESREDINDDAPKHVNS